MKDVEKVDAPEKEIGLDTFHTFAHVSSGAKFQFLFYAHLALLLATKSYLLL